MSGECRERGNEHVESLAGRDGADGQEMRHVVWLPCDAAAQDRFRALPQ